VNMDVLMVLRKMIQEELVRIKLTPIPGTGVGLAFRNGKIDAIEKLVLFVSRLQADIATQKEEVKIMRVRLEFGEPIDVRIIEAKERRRSESLASSILAAAQVLQSLKPGQAVPVNGEVKFGSLNTAVSRLRRSGAVPGALKAFVDKHGRPYLGID
jgi:hypothetical protein